MSMKMKKQVKQLLADDTSQGTDITGLKTDVGNLKTAVGSESTEGSILARIKALEDAQPSGDS